MIKSITLENLYKMMVSTRHIVDMSKKEEAETVTVDGIRFANAVVAGRRVIRECGTRVFFDYEDFDSFMVADGERVSPLSFGNFGVYPQCLDAFHYWLALALLADCMLNECVLRDVCGKFGLVLGVNDETL